MINCEYLKNCADEIGVKLGETALARFDRMAERLVRWNAHTNLTAITEPDEVVVKHFTDSLTVLAAVDIPSGARVADVGCGAGFPGLPLLFARPDLKLSFIDSVGKKLSFIEQTLSDEGISAEVLHARAEDLGIKDEYRESYDAVVSRDKAADLGGDTHRSRCPPLPPQCTDFYTPSRRHGPTTHIFPWRHTAALLGALPPDPDRARHSAGREAPGAQSATR